MPQLDDRNAIVALHSDPTTRLFLGGPKQTATINAQFDAALAAPANYWIVALKDGGSVIGEVSLDVHHDGVDTEISYVFAPASWGKGYATEVIGTVVRFAIEDLRLPRVVAETQAANQASCRLLERVGMRLEREVERFGALQRIYVFSPT